MAKNNLTILERTFRLVLIFLALLALAPATNGKTIKRSSTMPSSKQWTFMLSNWKEISTLLRNDGLSYEIKTLNTAFATSFQRPIGRSSFFTRSGLVVGKSMNRDRNNDLSYFQGSVLLMGLELALGYDVFESQTTSIGFSLGGLYRSIQHAVPASAYRFSTGNRFLPLATLDLCWDLSPQWQWVQRVGTSGSLDDTYWSLGFGYQWL